jgi:hypothetical protein
VYFFNIVYVYFLDPYGDALARRCNETRGLDEEHWLKVYEWQTKAIEIPDNKEIEMLNISNFININTFGV